MKVAIRPCKNILKILLSKVFLSIGIDVVWERYSAQQGLCDRRFLIIRGFEGISYIGKKHYVNKKRIILNFNQFEKFQSYTCQITDGCAQDRIPISIVEASLLPDGSFKPRRKLFLKSLQRSHLIGNGEKIAILPPEFDHFGHFIYQILPLLLKEKNYRFGMDIIEENDKNRVKEILDFFGIQYSLELIHIKAPKFASSAKQQGVYPGKKSAQLMAELIESKKRQSIATKNLYLTRKNAPQGRSISNDEELVHTLKKYNFEIVDPGTLSYVQQIELFSNSRVIVGAHGSAFANLIAMKKGSSVIELAGDRYVRWHVKKLASDLELKHHLIICETLPNDDLYLEISKFEGILMKCIT